MHREIRDRLEEVLAEPSAQHSAHLDACRECRDEVAIMQDHALALREWRAPDAVEPRAGFYARVMERIEAQGAGSIWTLFFESSLGRRLAVASLTLVLLLSVGLVTFERSSESPLVASDDVSAEVGPAAMLPGEDEPARVVSRLAADRDSVLVNLVTYREQ